MQLLLIFLLSHGCLAKDLYDVLSPITVSWMNGSQMPCDNFYEYVCGSWDVSMTSPSFYGEIEKRRNGIIEEILASKMTFLQSKNPAVLFFKSCIDASSNDWSYMTEIVKSIIYETPWVSISRSSVCSIITTLLLPISIQELYLNRAYDFTTFTDEVFKFLKEFYLQVIKRNKWIDITSQRYIIENLQNMQVVLVNKAQQGNREILHHQYFKENLNTLLMNYNKATHSPLSLTIVPHYDADQNKVIIPAGFMVPPAISNDYGISMKWSRLGYVVSHEIAHGIINFFREGRVSKATKDIYLKKQRCLITRIAKDNQEYKRNYPGNSTVNRLSWIETTADVIAYPALLQGLQNLTSVERKHLLISSAQTQCMSRRFDENQEARVKHVYRNVAIFRNTFECREHSNYAGKSCNFFE